MDQSRLGSSHGSLNQSQNENLQVPPGQGQGSPRDVSQHETTPLRGPRFGVTRWRWYILVMTCAAYFYHTFLWSFFGPIARSVYLLFGWNRGQISLFCLYAPASLLILTIPVGLLHQYFDIRNTTIVTWAILFVSSLLRCFEASVTVTTILGNISMVLCGAPSILALAMPLMVSAVWFPTDQRMLSTTIGVLMNEFGTIASFLVGPNVVPEPGTAPKQTILVDYLTYTRVVTGLGGLFLIGCIVYLPNKPKIPPAASAEEERLGFFEASKRMMRSKLFWLLSMVFAFVVAPYYILVMLMNLLLQPLGVSQVDAGYIGIAAAGISTIFGFIFGGIAGKYGHAKIIVLALHVVAVAGAIWLLLYNYDAIPQSTPGVGVAVVLYATGSSSMMGILQEMQADAVYPIPEIINAVVCLGIAMLPMTILMIITTIDQIPLDWFFWCLLATKVLGLVIMIFTKLETKRTDVDVAGMMAEQDRQKLEQEEEGSLRTSGSSGTHEKVY